MSKKKGKKIKVGYISYMVEQNEPSYPAIGTLETGKIREGLIDLWEDSQSDQVGKGVFKVESEDSWGDVRVSFFGIMDYQDEDDKPSESDIFIFATFENEKERKEALKELGLPIPKEE